MYNVDNLSIKNNDPIKKDSKNQEKYDMYNIHKSKKISNITHLITEEDFYPPEDKRTWKSGVEDIDEEDNFANYAKWFYDNYGDEIFDN